MGKAIGEERQPEEPVRSILADDIPFTGMLPLAEEATPQAVDEQSEGVPIVIVSPEDMLFYQQPKHLAEEENHPFYENDRCAAVETGSESTGLQLDEACYIKIMKYVIIILLTFSFLIIMGNVLSYVFESLSQNKIATETDMGLSVTTQTPLSNFNVVTSMDELTLTARLKFILSRHYNVGFH